MVGSEIQNKHPLCPQLLVSREWSAIQNKTFAIELLNKISVVLQVGNVKWLYWQKAKSFKCLNILSDIHFN